MTSQILAQSQQETNELWGSSYPSSPVSASTTDSAIRSMVAAGGSLPRLPAANLMEGA
jgi:hypothetical protein